MNALNGERRLIGRSRRRQGQGRRIGSVLENFAPLNGQTLLLPKHEIGIIWSPKSACTKVLLWYFNHIGLLDAAIFYHPFPHKYRTEVFYQSRGYMAWLTHSDWKNFTWYQFCRDPVKRALSSYRHNVGLGYADERISKALGRTVSNLEGYSLNDFLNYLETLDLATRGTDPHVRLQKNRIAKVVDITTVNIDEVDMLEAMNVIESQHGMPMTDFAALNVFANDDRRRAHFDLTQQYSPSQLLTHSDAKGKWPVEVSMLSALTVERIKRLYNEDMQFIYGNPARVLRFEPKDSLEQQTTGGPLASGVA
jgi:hypothetical protein